MKIPADFFRGFPLLVIFVSLLGVLPSHAQAQDTDLAADSLLPGNEITPDQESVESSKGITKEQRVKWFIESTIGPRSIAAGALSAGIGTGLDRPREYGATGRAFDRRYEIRLSGVAAGNAVEATLGAIWGEDPRYRRAPNEPFGGRVRNVVKLTFAAYRRSGRLSPAYARYIGISGSNFLANSWRAPSESNVHDAALRTCFGLLGRMGSNAFQEFWPDVKRSLFRE